MRLITSVSYYKRQRRGKSPAIHKARQPRGIGTTIHAKIMLDPSLRGHSDLRREVLRHEKNEMRAWGEGHSQKEAHKIAKRATKRDDHFDTTSEYWRLIDRRRKR